MLHMCCCVLRQKKTKLLGLLGRGCTVRQEQGSPFEAIPALHQCFSFHLCRLCGHLLSLMQRPWTSPLQSL